MMSDSRRDYVQPETLKEIKEYVCEVFTSPLPIDANMFKTQCLKSPDYAGFCLSQYVCNSIVPRYTRSNTDQWAVKDAVFCKNLGAAIDIINGLYKETAGTMVQNRRRHLFTVKLYEIMERMVLFDRMDVFKTIRDHRVVQQNYVFDVIMLAAFPHATSWIEYVCAERIDTKFTADVLEHAKDVAKAVGNSYFIDKGCAMLLEASSKPRKFPKLQDIVTDKNTGEVDTEMVKLELSASKAASAAEHSPAGGEKKSLITDTIALQLEHIRMMLVTQQQQLAQQQHVIHGYMNYQSQIMSPAMYTPFPFYQDQQNTNWLYNNGGYTSPLPDFTHPEQFSN